MDTQLTRNYNESKDESGEGNEVRKKSERMKPITSHVDLGNTTPVLGLTQYFFGFVVLTYTPPTIKFKSKPKFKKRKKHLEIKKIKK